MYFLLSIRSWCTVDGTFFTGSQAFGSELSVCLKDQPVDSSIDVHLRAVISTPEMSPMAQHTYLLKDTGVVQLWKRAKDVLDCRF